MTLGSMHLIWNNTLIVYILSNAVVMRLFNVV